ncbi:DUF2937 family protein [Devosia sp.]|uniref:DUF2937 family protein n=1 Tax=Devosia sp. TaxID=1871048 RepID=UPI0032646343
MRRTLAGIGGIGLAIALSQFPEYAQQYTQRLGGAVDELRVIVTDFDKAAREGGLDRQQALARFEASPDSFVAGRGISIAQTINRYETLSAALIRLESANAIERFQQLPAFLDTDVGSRTLEAFEPAVPVTFEGFAYAGIGLLAGYLVVSGIYSFVMLPFRRRYPGYRYR